MRTLSIWLMLLSGLFYFIACDNAEDSEENSWEVAATINNRPVDSLLTDMITYIYKKPKTASRTSKFDSTYRAFYLNVLPEFTWLYHTEGGDRQHYYYIIRPARSAEGNARGVAGSFELDQDGYITAFREVLNTPVLEEDSLRVIGKVIFERLIQEDMDAVLADSQLTAFPDDRVWYDESIHEWSYHQKQ